MPFHVFSQLPVNECGQAVKNSAQGFVVEAFKKDIFVTVGRHQVRMMLEEASQEAPEGFQSKITFSSLVPGESSQPLADSMWEVPELQQAVRAAIMALEGGEIYFDDDKEEDEEIEG